jgi:uncharacterized cupin superfamily protein
MQCHVIIDGNCWAGVVGQAPVRLGAGDVVLFPHGDGGPVVTSADVEEHGPAQSHGTQYV